MVKHKFVRGLGIAVAACAILMGTVARASTAIDVTTPIPGGSLQTSVTVDEQTTTAYKLPVPQLGPAGGPVSVTMRTGSGPPQTFSVVDTPLTIDVTQFASLKKASLVIQRVLIDQHPVQTGRPCAERPKQLYTHGQPTTGNVPELTWCTDTTPANTPVQLVFRTEFDTTSPFVPASGVAAMRATASQVVFASQPAPTVWSASGTSVVISRFSLYYWPDTVVKKPANLDVSQLRTDSVDKLAADIGPKLCVDLPSAWNPGDAAFYGSNLFTLVAYNGKTGAFERTTPRWAPDDPNRRSCVVLANGGQILPEVGAVLTAFQNEILSGRSAQLGVTTLIQDREVNTATVSVQSDVPFVDAIMLNDSKKIVSEIDINVPVDKQLAWVCLRPQGG